MRIRLSGFRIGLAVVFVATVVLTPVPARAAVQPTATVNVNLVYRGDAAGTLYSFVVTNGATATNSIGSVRIARPATVWTVTDCSIPPAGWTASLDVASCTFTSAAGTTDDIAAGALKVFSVEATTSPGNVNATGQWTVSSDADSTTFGGAGVVSTNLSATAAVFQITDAVVALDTGTAGGTCPPSQKIGAAGDTRTIIICGRNRGDTTLTPVGGPPNAGLSSLNGTLFSAIVSNSVTWGLTSGAIAPMTSSFAPVILGTYRVTITPTAGSNKTVLPGIASSTSATSWPSDATSNTFASYTSLTPNVRVLNIRTLEGDSGSHVANVTFLLNIQLTRAITFNWRTQSISATADTDYRSETHTGVTIAARSTVVRRSTVVFGDLRREDNESFMVRVSFINFGVPGSPGTVTITDDDTPRVAISDASATEGSTVKLTVSLSKAIAGPTTLSFETRPTRQFIGATACCSNVDYGGKQDLVIVPGGTRTATINVLTAQDSIDELNEPFFVYISAPSSEATVSDNRGTGTIVDNETTPGGALWIIRPSDTVTEHGPCYGTTRSVAEGTSASRSFNLKFVMDAVRSLRTEVYFETFPDTASSVDFQQRIGSVIMPARDNVFSPLPSVQAAFSTRADGSPEPNEEFKVRAAAAGLGNPCAVTINNPATIKILNDD